MKPQINQVTPYVAESNKTGTVTIRGLYLDQTTADYLDLMPLSGGAAIAPSSASALTSTEIEITHPPLAAGTYLVRMHDAQGAVVDRSTAHLVVVDPANFPSGTVAYPADARYRNVRSLLYDAERKALLLAIAYGGGSATDNVLMQFKYSSGWGSATVVPYPYVESLALSADGRDLIVGSNPIVSGDNRARIAALSPSTLIERIASQTTDFPFLLPRARRSQY